MTAESRVNSSSQKVVKLNNMFLCDAAASLYPCIAE